MNMKEKIATTVATLVLMATIVGVFKIEQYRFNDCKKVGHETFYCILNMGK